jgi:hypothetical protein
MDTLTALLTTSEWTCEAAVAITAHVTVCNILKLHVTVAEVQSSGLRALQQLACTQSAQVAILQA